jgi:ferredoxin-NADP reductase
MTATSTPASGAWHAATVIAIRAETPRVATIGFAVPNWPVHLAGQRVEVRLTAADGYRAVRSYSIASPPEARVLELTVERLEDGEVSPFLTGELRPGDTVELQGPIGGHFVWSAARARHPLLLVAGGTGIVPLMCMLRHRSASGSRVPAALLYSCATRSDVIYRDELDELARGDARFALVVTLTRDSAPGWPGSVGRIGVAAVRALLDRLGGVADSFACGSSGFVGTASSLLVQAGQPVGAIRTERFGPSGA